MDGGMGGMSSMTRLTSLTTVRATSAAVGGEPPKRLREHPRERQRRHDEADLGAAESCVLVEVETEKGKEDTERREKDEPVHGKKVARVQGSSRPG
mgnify:CR=1 FL=1